VAHFERFRAWQLCHELALAAYKATQTFPHSERYGLISQIRRAAYSAAANVAEGASKHGRGEFRRFLDIALGSLGELAYAFRLARDLEILDEPTWRELERMRNHAGVVTWKLYDAVRRGKP